MSADVEATKKFMGELMGWESKEMPTDKGPDYTMFFVGEDPVAGLGPLPPDMEGVPSHWSSYVKVDDLDQMVGKVEELGGKVVMPVMDVMTAGRMAGIKDPTGAALMLWEPKDHIGAGLVNTVGAMCWNELYTMDIEKAKDFYSKLLGWELEAMEGMENYVGIKNKGRSNGGMMQIQPEWGEVPPSWTVYFTVADLNETVARAKDLGGQVISEPLEAKGVGKFAMIQGPAGDVFTVIAMDNEPEHWKE